MSEAEAAAQMKVDPKDLHAVLSGERPVTAEWALRFGKFCGNGPELWMDMQAALDLWRAEQRIGNEIKAIPDHPCAMHGPRRKRKRVA